MKPRKFSPIENREQLLETIKYTHFRCFELLKKNFGKYLPVAGNIGIFCHYDEEYQFLTDLRKQLTVESDNWNQKYYRLAEPITISAEGGCRKPLILISTSVSPTRNTKRWGTLISF